MKTTILILKIDIMDNFLFLLFCFVLERRRMPRRRRRRRRREERRRKERKRRERKAEKGIKKRTKRMIKKMKLNTLQEF